MLKAFRDKLTSWSGSQSERPSPDTPDDTATAPERDAPDRPPANDPDRSPEDQAVSEEQRQLRTGEESPG